MSHKRYRIPAGSNSRHQPQPEGSGNQRYLEKVKAFLQTVLEKVTTALQAPPVANEEPTERTKALGALSRLGISACRTLLQALRLEGTDTQDVRAMLNTAETAMRENLMPAASG